MSDIEVIVDAITVTNEEMNVLQRRVNEVADEVVSAKIEAATISDMVVGTAEVAAATAEAVEEMQAIKPFGLEDIPLVTEDSAGFITPNLVTKINEAVSNIVAGENMLVTKQVDGSFKLDAIVRGGGEGSGGGSGAGGFLLGPTPNTFPAADRAAAIALVEAQEVADAAWTAEYADHTGEILNVLIEYTEAGINTAEFLVFDGTDWRSNTAFKALKGERGDVGPAGVQGVPGLDGSSFYNIVADEAARLAIPAADRQEGMHVYQVDTYDTWILVGGITNTDWHKDASAKFPAYLCVDNGVERDAIPAHERCEGMLVYLKSNDKTFKLGAGLTNADWNNVQNSDYRWGGTHQFTMDVTTNGKFVGIGAIDSVDQRGGYVLTAMSATEGDYTWRPATGGGGGGGGFDIAADYAVTGAWTFDGDLIYNGNQIHLGDGAGSISQGAAGVAIGKRAGNSNQGDRSIAIGPNSGETSQGAGSTSVGDNSGNEDQGAAASAFGQGAGKIRQGAGATALGAFAGETDQGATGLIINASGAVVDNTGIGHLQIETSEVSIKHDGLGNDTIEINQKLDVEGIETTGNINVAAPGVISGIGAVNAIDQTTGALLTAQSAVPGDYKWVDPAIIAGERDFLVVADTAARLGISAASCKIGMHVVQVDEARTYINITGNNGNLADWRLKADFDVTYTGTIRIDTDELHLGKDAGVTNPGTDSSAYGRGAGQFNLGDYALVMGFQAGAVGQGANSIFMNTSGTAKQNTNDNSFGVDTGVLEIGFDGTAGDDVTINQPIEVTEITLTRANLITGEDI